MDTLNVIILTIVFHLTDRFSQTCPANRIWNPTAEQDGSCLHFRDIAPFSERPNQAGVMSWLFKKSVQPLSTGSATRRPCFVPTKYKCGYTLHQLPWFTRLFSVMWRYRLTFLYFLHYIHCCEIRHSYHTWISFFFSFTSDNHSQVRFGSTTFFCGIYLLKALIFATCIVCLYYILLTWLRTTLTLVYTTYINLFAIVFFK